MGMRKRTIWIVAMVLVVAGSGLANWSDTFSNGAFDLATWEFPAFPDMTGTFTQTVKPGAEGNDYMAFEETTSMGAGGSAFGAGFGSAEIFRDVRVGAVVNVVGDASHSYHGFLARANYFIDPDGSLTGVAPGFVATCYILHVNWEDGPANLRIDLEKVVMNQNIMRENIEAVVPVLGNNRSYYAELDVVGSGPVYVTGSLYEYKGGPLVARTPVMIDTNGNDPWEDPDKNDAVFTEGISGIFAQNENSDPVGFYVTWDDVSSLSDGPAAVAPSPANGATDVSILTDLSWLEGKFATGRQLWFGKAGEMAQIEQEPAGAAFDPGMLEADQRYQWRVDQIGPGGVVTGHTWQFTTGDKVVVEDFEAYASDEEIQAAWPHNIPPSATGIPFQYVFLDTGTKAQGAKGMRFEYQNQYEPFFTEATLTFDAPQDWTIAAPDLLSLAFRGRNDNLEQTMYVRVVDAEGNEATVPHPYSFASQSEPWRSWEIPLAELTGVDLTAVAKLTLGAGNGTAAAEEGEDGDTLFIDNIGLRVSADE